LGIFLNHGLHFPLTFYGLLFTINTLLIVFFEVPLNIVTLAWPPRLSLAVGSFFVTLGFTGLLFVTTEWHVFILVLFCTLGEMILFPSAHAYMAEISPEHERGNYMSIFNMAMNFGYFLGPLLGGLIISGYSYQALWLICGIWGLVSVLIFAFLPQRKA